MHTDKFSGGARHTSQSVENKILSQHTCQLIKAGFIKVWKQTSDAIDLAAKIIAIKMTDIDQIKLPKFSKHIKNSNEMPQLRYGSLVHNGVRRVHGCLCILQYVTQAARVRWEKGSFISIEHVTCSLYLQWLQIKAWFPVAFLADNSQVYSVNLVARCMLFVPFQHCFYAASASV